MTSAALAEYLKVIRDAGCMSAAMKGFDDSHEAFELSVVMAPDTVAPTMGEVPTAGGWKSPNLDSNKLFENEEHSV